MAGSVSSTSKMRPADADARALLSGGSEPRDAAREVPASSLAWALLAEAALRDVGDPVAAYAYARTGYHRGLDALRRAGRLPRERDGD